MGGPNLCGGRWNELCIKFQHSKFCRIEDLVAEFAITFNAENFKIDVSSYQKLAESVHTLLLKNNAPPPEYAQNANLSASVPHCGIPFG